MKHIDIKYHFTHHLIEAGIIELEYRSLEEMVADILTKPLPISNHVYLMEILGLHPPRLEEAYWTSQAKENVREVLVRDKNVGMGIGGEESKEGSGMSGDLDGDEAEDEGHEG
jgi:hypothetical protein